MGKNKMKGIIRYAGYASILLALAAIAFMFAPAIVYSAGDNVYNYNAFQTMFGYTEQIKIAFAYTDVQLFDFSFMNFAALIVLVGGIVLSVLKILFGKKAKLFTLIATACFIVAGVFLFMNITFAVPHVHEGTLASYALDKSNMTLGWGAIVGAICALIAGACKLGELLLD